MKPRWFAVSALVAISILYCGGNTTTPDGGASCVPNQSVACTGPAGCSGAQVCNANGTAFGFCDCGQGDGGPLADVNTSDVTTGPDGSDADSATYSDITNGINWSSFDFVSSRKRPLKDSTYAFCTGLPG
jgi:hypothetical protein